MAATHSYFGSSTGFEGNTCAVADNTVFCWGTNPQGGVGNGLRVPQFTPIGVGGALINTEGANGWILAVGGGTTCAARRPAPDAPRELYCWGDGNNGELLGVSFQPSASAAPLLLPHVDDVSVGADHVCAVTDRKVYCWGSNSDGQTNPSSVVEMLDSPHCVEIP